MAAQKSVRDTRVEMFRCILMFMIVLYHCQMFGCWAWKPYWWCEVYHAFLIWHVPAFVAISGWFGIKFTFKKFFKIWGVIAFYSIIGFLYEWYFCGGKSWIEFKVDGGWFGGTYLALMLVAPFLNLAILKMKELPQKDVLLVFGLFVLMTILNWMPRACFTGCRPNHMGGSTLTMMVVIYVAAALVREFFIDWFTVQKIGLVVLIYFICASLYAFGVRMFPIGMSFSNYDSPIVWIMGVTMLVFVIKYVKSYVCYRGGGYARL